MEIKVMKGVYDSNEKIAAHNRRNFAEHRTLAVNILGSPGSGKTTLLEASIGMLKEKIRPAVIEGDLSTDRDASRIAAHGVPVIQINTNGGCHLDAQMIAKVLPDFDLSQVDLMIIENVGNLVCPAAFDLGEDFKVVVLSIAEGADKPAKYPRTFLEASAVVINKIDLLPFSDVNLEELKRDIRNINPDIKIFEVSCRLRQGLDNWAEWLVSKVREKQENE
ncbi:hydrogenase nickel incorporation protein HypB [Calderihabitans maritimus]|uniref:Hydrogenase nickel incorporation protein HypB n=1 Tax=Calderihabitans maritimus TaxID=1246530 RepID=A0A1Z5HP10_9FIRM|nr:hydrogenase nickel incorporation protein HypB [Calderihabitans maritimus]GAW91117.1 Hydrogenase nickel incorporation protein HypB [Calderihabitans maritimus]